MLELEIRKRTCSMALLTSGSFWSMDGCTTRSTCGEAGASHRAGEGPGDTRRYNSVPCLECRLCLLSLALPKDACESGA